MNKLKACLETPKFGRIPLNISLLVSFWRIDYFEHLAKAIDVAKILKRKRAGKAKRSAGKFVIFNIDPYGNPIPLG